MDETGFLLCSLWLQREFARRGFGYRETGSVMVDGIVRCRFFESQIGREDEDAAE